MMLVAAPGALRTALPSVVVHMGGGQAFTVWTTLDRFRRTWERANLGPRLIELHGLRRTFLNPRQIVMVEGRR